MASTTPPLEYKANELISHAIVAAVADTADCDPLELEPLYNYIDPDAVNAIFQSCSGQEHEQTAVTLEFTYSTYQVTVTADHVRVTDSEN